MLQWTLNLIPDSFLLDIYYTFILISIVLYVGSKLSEWIPFIKQYIFLTEVIGVIGIAVGCWLASGQSTNQSWEQKLKEQSQKVAIVEAKSGEANANIQTRIVKQTQVIHDTQVVIEEKIKEVASQIDKECKLDPQVPKILNDAAKYPSGSVK